MKSFFCFFLFACSLAIPARAQTLFTYGNKQVSKDEFLKAYNKNNTSGKPDEKSLREYLDLYIRFKLKVQAAYDLRLDTLPSQKAELQSFRSQIIQNYLSDQGSVDELLDEAFARSRQDVRISHIFIPVKENDSAQVIQKAARQIEEAYKQLQQGKDFGEVAMAFSADTSARTNKGDLGFITVFSLPYELETIAYKMPVGNFSAPFRSKAGYHIFKKTEERKAAGKIKVAQILLTIPPGTDEAGRLQVKQKADSIYQTLLKGSDFGTLAAQFSNDNFSYQLKGELPEFGIGRYNANFEIAAFALKKDGDISQPVATEFGYHIIKRLSLTEVPSDKSSKEYMDQLQQQVSTDERIAVAKKTMLQKMLKQSGYKKAAFDAAQFRAYTDSSIYNKPVPAKTTIRPNTILFSFAKQNITVHDWLDFRRSINDVNSISGGKTNAQLLEYYTELAATEYYKKHLEEFNKDFAFQLKEFKDGNLLFEIMQRNIWDKAAGDSSGLRKFFNTHKNNYWWENSIAGVLFTTPNEATAKELQKRVQDSIAYWRGITETYEGNVIADSGRFEIEQLSLPANYSVSLKTFSPYIKNQTDTSVSFVYILHHYPKRALRNFDEAKGYVINDYQAYLEEAWITQLKKKYPIKIDEAVFRSMLK